MESSQFSKISKLCSCVFLFYVFWFRYSYGENKGILYGSIGVATICMIIDLCLSESKPLPSIPWGVLVNIVMCIYSLITGLLVAVDLNILMSGVKTYVCFSIMLIIIFYISKVENGIDWIIKALIGVCIVCAGYVIFRGYYWPRYGYVLSRDNNPNRLGVLMDIGIFCVIFRTKRNPKLILAYLGLIALFTYIIVGCGSRKGLIAAAIMCSLAFFPVFKDLWVTGNQIKRIIMIILVIALVYGVYYYFKQIYISSDSYQRMQMLGDSEEGSSAHRMLYYQYAWDYCQQHPLFGIGLSQFIVWNPYRQYSHSTFAEALADWGIIGCIIYFSPVVLAGKRLIHLLLQRKETYILRIIFALWATELFLGIGQIWFYDETHLILWTLIYISIDAYITEENHQGRGCKYVKD